MAVRISVFFLMIFLLSSKSSFSVVVAGANGGADNTNNTARAQLEALPSVSSGFFLDNVIQFAGGNAVYLGFDPNNGSPIAYALTGMHLGTHSTLTIQTISYSITHQISIGGSDLALLRLTQTNNLMPSLQPLILSSTPLSNNIDVIMIGHGRSRIQNASTNRNTSDAIAVTNGTGYTTSATRQLRWGTNSTSDFDSIDPIRSFDIDGRTTITGRTVFDQPSRGQWLTTNQAQAVVNDSGGGIFRHDGTLVGIMVAVQAPNANEARFGNTTLFADIASYKTQIDTEIGASLIPEPSIQSLFLLAFLGYLVARNSRRKVGI